ncbi:MAG: hypothetical protein Q8N23_35150 [Archangium sp.]|nr:hypothetical protein [Archangium sp.]MDP3574910.1 hypothetical protein [Archangium sp.]
MNALAVPRSTQTAAEVRVKLEVAGRASSRERAKLASAAALLQGALNDSGVEAGLKQRFGAVKGAQIYKRILSGAETLSPRHDGEADLRVGFFDARRGSRQPIARSSSSQSRIDINRSGFDDRDPVQVARTLGHMLAYKMGYSGAVPEVLGKLSEQFARTVPAPTSGPVPGPITPIPGGNAAQLITAFHQGKEGNCVSIAAIKAAMARFGADQVFTSLRRVGAGYEAVMRDGFSCRVSDAELQLATRESRMVGRNTALLDRANLLYAAMAKRAQMQGNDNRSNMSFARACESLNDGENYLEGAKWLGLSRHVKKISPSEVSRYTAVVAASARHAVFATGTVVDHYGSSRPSSRGGATVEGWGRRITGAYAFV